MTKTARNLSLDCAWRRYLTRWAQATTLKQEAYTLTGEADTLWAEAMRWAEAEMLKREADRLWREAVRAAHEGPVTIEWRSATWCLVDGTDAFTEDT